jgi:hypothetical protein
MRAAAAFRDEDAKLCPPCAASGTEDPAGPEWVLDPPRTTGAGRRTSTELATTVQSGLLDTWCVKSCVRPWPSMVLEEMRTPACLSTRLIVRLSRLLVDLLLEICTWAVDGFLLSQTGRCLDVPTSARSFAGHPDAASTLWKLVLEVDSTCLPIRLERLG